MNRVLGLPVLPSIAPTPDLKSMLGSLIWMLLLGCFAGEIARRLGLPPLVGMVLVGMGLGPEGANLIDGGVLGAAHGLRTIAVMVILMKAGLGLDRDKLAQQGTVALRLGVLPALGEALVITWAAVVLLRVDLTTGLLLGCILAAESPAVIVPGMLQLKGLGWGVAKGIPDAVLTGSALSNVLVLLLFNLLLGGLSQPGAVPRQLSLVGIPLQVLGQLGLGLVLGWGIAHLLVALLGRQNPRPGAIQEALVVGSLALGLVVLAQKLPIFSGYLAVMATGFCLVELDAPLARGLRASFDSLWVIAEIMLFVLLGASIHLGVLGSSLGGGLLVLAIGTLVGRSLGWYLSTLGSNWTWRERLFLLPANSAKATVQAAIGAIPLAQGMAGGETILALSALSILVTAPLGAWAIPTFAPKLLTQDRVNPTRVAVGQPMVLLAAIDGSALTAPVLIKAADLARRSEAEVIVVHGEQRHDPTLVDRLRQQSQQHLADIRYRLITTPGNGAAAIIDTAQAYGATAIVIGKRGHRPRQQAPLGSVCRAVLETSPLPVVVVENSYQAEV